MNSRANQRRSWSTADLIDFEYLVAGSDDVGAEAAYRRSRETFQAEVLPDLREQGELSKRGVFRAWLDVFRRSAGGVLPGAYWISAWQLLLVLVVLVGLSIGGSLTATLLFYRGDVPVNVPWFLACTLGVQLLILALAGLVVFIRKTTRLLEDFRPLQSLLGGIITLFNAGMRRLPGDQRERLRLTLANVSAHREIYGSLATWPIVVITQVFGVCFNLGILAVLLAHLSFKDVEFGWQSSLMHSNEAAYRIAADMATPWKWFAPHPHPTLQEVEESHFQFDVKQSNKSWWPFLCYAILCYGLLPRLALLIFAIVRWKSSLRQLSFDHGACLSFYRQLIGPTVHSSGENPALVIPAPATGNQQHAASGNTIAIVATDLEISESEITDYLRSAFGWQLVAMHRAQIDYPSGNAQLLEELAKSNQSLASVVAMIGADRAPIKAIALTLAAIRKALGSSTELVLLIVGRRATDGFSPVDAEELKHWKNFAAINRLPISLETWSTR